MAGPPTVVHALWDRARERPNEPALFSKRRGVWEPTTWAEYQRRVSAFARGLIALGLKRGQAVAFMAFNREEWVIGDLATIAAGGVPVGLYTTSSPEQLAYVLGHCEAPIVVVEDASYVARVEAVRAQLPALKTVVVMNPAGVAPERARSFDEIVQLGNAGPVEPLEERMQSARPGDLATLIYTSGTTGFPKGVMLTHHNMTWTAEYLSSCFRFERTEVILSYLPLSHIAEQVISIHGPVWHGMQVYFAESFDKLPENLREVRPTVFFGVPRVWEKFKARAEARVLEQPPSRQRLFAWARRVTLAYHQRDLEKLEPSIRTTAQYRAARRLVLSRVKERIGFDRTRLFATSAAPIGKDVLEFFASIDIVVREIYGQSEVTGPTSVNTPGATRLGSLGRPMPGVEVRLGDDGEILVRGGNVCAGYYKDPAATAELLEGGWLHSGDLGAFDADGYLRVIGRKKEIIVTSGGKKTPPANIESLLRTVKPIGHAMVVGDRRNYLVALITLDPDAVPAIAAEHGWPQEPGALARTAEFQAWLMGKIDAEVNPRLSRFEMVKKIHVLPNEFSIEGEELTSTLKVRRAVVAQKYAAQIDALYQSPATD